MPAVTRRTAVRLVAGAAAAGWLAQSRALATTPAPAGGGQAPLRVGVLKFGTVNWQLATLSHHRFDASNGFSLELTELASKSATAVALQSGAVDMIVSDWVWVARQRAAGAAYLFHPYSHALGALVVGSGSDASVIADLAGKRLGIAGGPLDKSWIVLRALAEKTSGRDLADVVEPVFAAPPLLSEELLAGRIDAALTFWPYAVRLRAAGLRRLISVEEALAGLGITPAPPLVGYVFPAELARQRADALAGFARALTETNALLRRSDAEWQRLRPLMRAPDDAVFAALKERHRAGIPQRWTAAHQAAAADLLAILVRLGGPDLVGDARTLDPAMFWPAAS